MNTNLEHVGVGDWAAWAGHTSLAAVPLGLGLLLLARSRWLSPQWRLGLIGLFFFRLILPAVPAVGWHPWTETAVRASVSMPSSGGAGLDHGSWSALEILSWVWLIGVVGMLVWLVGSHLILVRRLRIQAGPVSPEIEAQISRARARMGITKEVRVQTVSGLVTLAIFGWWRPRLLVPADLETRYSDEQIQGMLLHEFAHVRRGDVLWSWLALLVCALHWFNPFAWLAFRRFCAEREILCDAAALRSLGSDQRHSYGAALLSSLEVEPPIAGAALASFFFDHAELRQRLQAIVQPPRMTARARLIAASVLAVLCWPVFTTSRAHAQPEPASSTQNAAEEKTRGDRKTEDGDGKKSAEDEKAKRDGDRPKTGSRDGEVRKSGPRDGEARKAASRDGDGRKAGPRDGEAGKKGPRDGEVPKKGPRDGEARPAGPRDGDKPRTGPRDEERPRSGDGDRQVKED